MSRLSEDDLIERFFRPLAGPAGLGLKDDAGLVAVPSGHELVVTTDMLVAGVHFFAADAPGSIARKALRVNLSDLAAKRSRPVGFLLSIALPAAWTPPWLEDFVDGLAADARVFGCPLIGGDTVATPGPLTVSITAFGLVQAGAMLPRTGAREGDAIYVSGTVGDAALGLQLRLAEQHGGGKLRWGERLDHAQRDHLLDRYLHPRPRLSLRSALDFAHAGMDVSDGLVGDLAKLLRVSGVSGRLDVSRVPLSGAAACALAVKAGVREIIVTGGDDYELLATVPAHVTAGFEAAAAEAGVCVTRIGDVCGGTAPLQVTDAQGRSLSFERSSYSHA